MSSCGEVTLTIAGYNQIKSENTKFNMFLDRMFEGAELRPDYSGIDFDARLIEEIVHIIYPDRYKKKLAALRSQQTKLSKQKLEWERKERLENENSEQEKA